MQRETRKMTNKHNPGHGSKQDSGNELGNDSKLRAGAGKRSNDDEQGSGSRSSASQGSSSRSGSASVSADQSGASGSKGRGGDHR
jgi:hypothetical protein